jgi:hypothetical protein
MVERELHDAETRALRGVVEERLWTVLNDPTMNLARVPYVAAGAVGAVLVRVLVAMADSRPSDVTFGLSLVHQLEMAFVERTTDIAPPTTTH